MSSLSRGIGGHAPGELEIAVALGKIPGWRSFRKFGMNDVVVASSTQEMWPVGTAKVWPTSAGTASIVSDNAADTVTTGTGTWTLTIQGLDASYNEVEETVSMTGLTPVVTTQTFMRVNRMFGVTAGSNGVNVGNITASVGGNAQAYIEAAEGQTHQTHYTVPAGHTLLVTSFTVRTGRMSGNVDLHVLSQIRLKNGGDEHWRSVSDVYLYSNGHQNAADVTTLPEKTDIRQVIDSTTTTQVIGVFGGFLVDNAHK